MVKPIPEGYQTVIPYLTVKDAGGLLEFMKQAFGATEKYRMDGPDGSLGHAEVQIGDCVVMLGANPMEPPMPAGLVVYVEDCDATFKRALAAGGQSERDPQDMFYGDRQAGVRDRFGNLWWISTHIEDVPPEELPKRAQEAMAQMQA
jgi:uncharacterized glyoxalase superfamily protein PhnB